MLQFQRDAKTFERWVSHLAARLRRTVTTDQAATAWRTAGQVIAARTAVAVGREGWLAATNTADQMRLAASLTIPLSSRRGFGLCEPTLGSSDPRLEDPLRLWDWVCSQRPLPSEHATRVARELADSRFNLALCLVAATARAWFPVGDPRRNDPEHLVTLGHPWHPMTKTRLGLSLAEHIRHAPEFLARATVTAVDVDRDLCTVSDHFAERTEALLGTAPRGRVRIPVHEAQLRRLPRLLGGLMGTAIVPASAASCEGRSLLSLRTVWAGDLHFKLALDMHTTSARRLVSTMSVSNGPVVSQLLADIAAEDPLVARLEIADERDAVGLRGRAAGEAANQLGCIIRDARHFAAGPDDVAVWVCAGLDAKLPTGSTPLDRLCGSAPQSPPMQALAMLERYVEALVVPCARLFFGYGISLEPHLQNTLIRLRTDGGLRCVVRDLGGIRVHQPRLVAAGFEFQPAPGSFISTDDIDEVRDKLTHTLLHAHMCTIIGWLERDFGIDAAKAWNIVARGIRRGASAAGDRTEDLERIFAPRVRAKALFVMRLWDKSSDYDFTEVDNPLANTTP